MLEMSISNLLTLRASINEIQLKNAASKIASKMIMVNDRNAIACLAMSHICPVKECEILTRYGLVDSNGLATALGMNVYSLVKYAI